MKTTKLLPLLLALGLLACVQNEDVKIIKEQETVSEIEDEDED